MILDRRSNSHDEGREIRRVSGPGVQCGYSDVVAVGQGEYRCTVCKLDMTPRWPAQVLAAGLPLPKWPRPGATR